MKIMVQKEWYTVENCIKPENVNKIYVFGDNMRRTGRAGQAVIRNIENSRGVATKRAPSREDCNYFSDKFGEILELTSDLKHLHDLMITPALVEYTLVFPYDGLGTGLSELPKRSPFINNLLSVYLEKYFGVLTDANGKLSLKNQ